jgi:hypothetical protein
LLAGIRTDLDSFSNAEADALMLSGYRMTEHYFSQVAADFPTANGGAGNWRFLQIAPIVQAVDKSAAPVEDLCKTLRAGASLAWKPYRVSAPLRFGGLALAGVWAAGALVYLWRLPFVGILPSEATLRSWRDASIGMVLAVAAAAGVALWSLKWLLGKLRYRPGFLSILSSIALCIPAHALLWLHLRLIEPAYLKSGPKYRA